MKKDDPTSPPNKHGDTREKLDGYIEKKRYDVLTRWIDIYPKDKMYILSRLEPK